MTNGCEAVGVHFNPDNMTHGAPDAPERHVGDLGNIQVDQSGVARFDMEDAVISLSGFRGVVGLVLNFT